MLHKKDALVNWWFPKGTIRHRLPAVIRVYTTKNSHRVVLSAKLAALLNFGDIKEVRMAINLSNSEPFVCFNPNLGVPFVKLTRPDKGKSFEIANKELCEAILRTFDITIKRCKFYDFKIDRWVEMDGQTFYKLGLDLDGACDE